MERLINDFVNLSLLIHMQLPILLKWLAVFWGVHFVNVLLGYRLNILGIYPRSIHGFLGIPFAPFLHGSFNHLFFNSIPLIILANLVYLSGTSTFYCVSTLIILLGGLAVWLVGRRAIHIGASGLIMGYWAFLLTTAYQQRTILTILLAVICLYYFGSFLMDLLPGKVSVSWEAHLFGAAAGLSANTLIGTFQLLQYF